MLIERGFGSYSGACGGHISATGTQREDIRDLSQLSSSLLEPAFPATSRALLERDSTDVRRLVLDSLV